MARVSRALDPFGRAFAASVRALVAGAALAVAPHPAFASDAAPDVPAPIPLSFSIRALEERFRLLSPPPRFLDRAVAAREAGPREPESIDWKRFLVDLESGDRFDRSARAVPESAAVTVDSGGRLGCRIGDMVPYARLDVRSFAARDGALREAAALASGAGGAGSLLRALGVRVDLDTRTVLQFEASLGEPDLFGGGSGDGEDDRSLGVAIRFTYSF